VASPLLAIEDLAASFDGFRAVDGLSMQMDASELRVIIGPNGAGKTTLLDLICGRTRATQGAITFKGRELTRLAEHEIVRAGVGRKFQTPSIYENLTVSQNLELSFPRHRGVFACLVFTLTPDIKERVHQVAEQVFLGDRLDDRADLLSHGQMQWLEIGMLLMQDPDLLMLDEPVAGMSVSERKQTVELLKSINGNHAVIVIEHDMDFVKDIAQRVTVLHQGKILTEGSIDEVQADPRVIEVYLGN
jgi:urea transport system ATP-binding protein